MNIVEFDFITPFYLSAKEIFEQFFQTNINVSEINQITTDITLDDISVSLDLKSNSFQGKVYYFMSTEFVISLLNVMIGSISELNLESEMTKSALLELNNMITGKALTKLSEIGSIYNMGVPEIIVGKGTRIFESIVPMSSVILDNGSNKFNVCFLTSHIEKIVKVQKDPISKQSIISNLAASKKLPTKNLDTTTTDELTLLSKSFSVLDDEESPSVDNSFVRKTVVDAINEIKHLSGDNEFLLRKNNTIAQLANVLANLK